MSSNPEIGSLNRTRAIMKEYGIHAKKGFGQNFLTDLNVLKNIVKAAAITKEDNVIEIGPGLGALTEQPGTGCWSGGGFRNRYGSAAGFG